MLGFPVWKTVLIMLVCLAGVVLTIPNFNYATVEMANDGRAALQEGNAPTPEQEAAMAGWPGWLPSSLVNLGLDLRGGAHVLLEIQVEDVYAERLDAFWPEMRDSLRDMRDSIGTIRRLDDSTGGVMRVRVGNPEAIGEAVAAVRALTQPTISVTGMTTRDFEVRTEGDEIIVTLTEAEQTATNNRTMQQTLEIIRKRVDETGTREPTIQRQGQDRVLVQVPGIGSAEELIALLGRTARLTFHEVVRVTGNPDERAGPGNIILPDLDDPNTSYVLSRRAVVSGDHLADAQPTFDQNGLPAVSFRFDPAGARAFGRYTTENVGRLFATVLDGEVITAPRINEPITGGSGIITGNFDIEESTRLAILLRAGALPAELSVLEQRTIGPELGQDSIDAGRIASVVAFVGVLVFMGLAYGLFGLFANISLILNVALIFALLSVIGATLTLPGIAGIVLTIGMAVDANVLIFERIREELKRAKGPARAIEQGYDKAFSAIVDANITTFIAAVILFTLGAGPVRGFAVTLGLGIMTSLFTALLVTRVMVGIWFDTRKPKMVEV